VGVPDSVEWRMSPARLYIEKERARDPRRPFRERSRYFSKSTPREVREIKGKKSEREREREREESDTLFSFCR
jgi:hypothetical protein